MTNNSAEESRVLKANIAYHSALAETYDAKQPHLRPENVARIERILADMATKTGGSSLLDLGCGTGFIINIAKKYFKCVVGIDITSAMVKLIDNKDLRINLCLAETGKMPFCDNKFDVITAYGFLHHLFDLHPTLSEVFRCLRPGGLFFADQDPNYYYWWLMQSIKKRDDLTEAVQREVRSVVSASEDIATETGLSLEDVSLAEFQKIMKGGFDADIIVLLLKELGFCSVEYRFEWFLGQGKVLHQQSAAKAKVIESFLRESLPATRHLFKYLSFSAEKRS